MTLERYDLEERADIDAFNRQRVAKGQKPVPYNQALNDIAQLEAQRLATAEILQDPPFDYLKRYEVYSFKVMGIKGKTYGSVF
jgi:hypothetical protein